VFDEAVRVAASWDWVTPVIAMYHDWKYRPSTGFFWPYGSGSVWEVKRYLKSKGVLVWGGLVVGNQCQIRVRESQAEYAAFLIGQLGVPFQGGISAEKAKKYRKQRKEARQK